MEDPKLCPKCGHNAVRTVRLNPRGKEVRVGFIWLFFGLSVLILISSFFGSYGVSGNHLLYALPGIILLLVAIFYLFLFSRLPRRFRCDNSHTWEWP